MLIIRTMVNVLESVIVGLVFGVIIYLIGCFCLQNAAISNNIEYALGAVFKTYAGTFGALIGMLHYIRESITRI